MIRLALVPPKPNEFDRTVLMAFFLATLGTKSIAVCTDGLSKFNVGGHILSRIARTEKIASTAPAAPSKWPIADLVEDIETFEAALPSMRSTAFNSISSPNGVDVPWAFT